MLGFVSMIVSICVLAFTLKIQYDINKKFKEVDNK